MKYTCTTHVCVSLYMFDIALCYNIHVCVCRVHTIPMYVSFIFFLIFCAFILFHLYAFKFLYANFTSRSFMCSFSLLRRLLLIRWIAVCSIILLLLSILRLCAIVDVAAVIVAYVVNICIVFCACMSECLFALKYFKSHIIANRSIYMFTHRVLWHFIASTYSFSLSLVVCVRDSFGGRCEWAKESWKQSKELTMSMCRKACTLHVILPAECSFLIFRLFMFLFFC